MLNLKLLTCVACLCAVAAASFTPEQEAFIKAHNLETSNEPSTIQKFFSNFMSIDSSKKTHKSIGYFTQNIIDFPQMLMLLEKLGKTVQFPSYQYEEGRYSCGGQTCSGYHDLYKIQNGVLHNIAPARVTGGIDNGTNFWVKVETGHLQVRCPECFHEHLDLHRIPPNDTVTTLKRNLTATIKDITMLTTFSLEKIEDGLRLDNLDFTINFGEISRRYQNATVTDPWNGREEVLGEQVVYETWFEDEWNAEGSEESAERYMQDTLNCFLSGGKSHDNCQRDLNDVHYNMLLSQMIHGLGLNALNKQRQDNDTNYKCLVDALPTEHSDTDEITLFSQVLFDIGTQVIQTGRILSEYWDFWGFDLNYPLPLPVRFHTECLKRICNGTDCDHVLDELAVGQDGYFDDFYNPTSGIYGSILNAGLFQVDKKYFSYDVTIPKMQFLSTDFSRNITNLNTTKIDQYEGLELLVSNTTVGMKMDFDFADGHFVVENVLVKLYLGNISMTVSKHKRFEDGSWIELPPVKKEIGEKLMELWNTQDEQGKTVMEKYSQMLEEKINQVLAGKPL